MNKLITRLIHFFKKSAANKYPESFPDFDNFTYEIAVLPDEFKLLAWRKLQECERRIAIYRWAEQLLDPHNSNYRIFYNDTVSAFLMTFESTIQILKKEYEKKFINNKFEEWFKNLPQNDVQIKGLRTLRIFEAHLDVIKPIRRHIKITLSVPEPRTTEEILLTFRLPKLTETDIKSVKYRKLELQDLPEWNSFTENAEVITIFKDSVEKLKQILKTAETKIS